MQPFKDFQLWLFGSQAQLSVTSLERLAALSSREITASARFALTPGK
jgi:hypothetical protein